MDSGIAWKTSKKTRIIKNTAWVTREDMILTTGRIWAGKIVFLIRLTLLIIEEVEPDIISEKTNQLVIPAVNHTTKGTLSVGIALNPRLKTTQKTKIKTRGGINVHTTPRVEPIYWVLTSLLAMEMIRRLLI